MGGPNTPGGPTLTAGYQTPLTDPLKALMNALRMQGRYISMGNPYVMSSLRQQSESLTPRFLQQLMATGMPEGSPGDVNEDTMFGDFLSELTRGRTTMPTWGMGQAQSTLTGISDLLRQIDQSMSGADLDLQDPGSITKAAAQGLLSPLQRAIGGLYWGDYPEQQKLYTGAYSSALGSKLGGGLETVTKGQGLLWSQLLGEAFGAAGSPASFLDMLLGRLLGSVGGAPGAGPRVAAMTPGGITSVGGRFPGGANTARVPGQAPDVYGPTMGGYGNPAGQMFNQVPSQQRRSILERLMELLGTGGIRR